MAIVTSRCSRGADDERSSAKSAISAPPRHIGRNTMPCGNGAPAIAIVPAVDQHARRPRARARRRPRPRSGARRSQQHAAPRAAAHARPAMKKPKCRLALHAGGGAEHHGGAHATAARAARSSSASRSARSARTPASACDRRHADERHAGDRRSRRAPAVQSRAQVVSLGA